MNPEIIKLIEFAITDGEVSPKDREIIREKAKKLGENPDEAEMILEAELLLKKEGSKNPPIPPKTTIPPVQKKKTNKRGDIEICPSCGAETRSMEFTCHECGHEYTELGSSSGLAELKMNLKKVDEQTSLNSTNKGSSVIQNSMDEDLCISLHSQGNVIRAHSFQNTKEELIDHLTYSVSQIKSINLEIEDIKSRIGTDMENTVDKQLLSSFNYVSNAWEGLVEQCRSKAKLFINDEKELEKILSITGTKTESSSPSEIEEDFYPNGQIKSKGKFQTRLVEGIKRKIPQGIHTFWYENSNKKNEKNYSDSGVLHGKQYEWHENGNLKRQYHCEDGLLEGMVKVWFESGNIFGETYYKNNAPYGPERYWYDNGQFKLKRVYIDKQINGIATLWNEDGGVRMIEVWKDGEFEKGIYYDDYGNETDMDSISSRCQAILESTKI